MPMRQRTLDRMLAARMEIKQESVKRPEWLNGNLWKLSSRFADVRKESELVDDGGWDLVAARLEQRNECAMLKCAVQQQCNGSERKYE